jgi:hypothetical protein
MTRSLPIIAFAAFVASACATTSTPRVVQVDENRAVAYQQEIAEVRTAYLQAIELLGWELQTTEEDHLLATSESADNAAFGIRFFPADTLQTLARIVAVYAPYLDDSTDRLEQLLSEVEARVSVDGGTPFPYPLAAYPEGTRTCTAPTYRNHSEVTPPEPHGGTRQVAMRFGSYREARLPGVQGRIVVHFVVDADGEVECAVVWNGLPGILNQAAVQAVASSTFEPGRKDGEPVRMMSSIPLNYLSREMDGLPLSPVGERLEQKARTALPLQPRNWRK